MSNRLVSPKSADARPQIKLAAEGAREDPVDPEAAPRLAGQGPNEVDDYKTRVAKYVPAEVLAFYITFAGVIEATSEDLTSKLFIGLVLLAISVIAVPLYIRKCASPKQPWGLHAVVSTAAFLVWAYAYGIPFQDAEIAGKTVVNRTLGAVLLGGFTLTSGAFAPKRR